jgi:hypothetical protein
MKWLLSVKVVGACKLALASWTKSHASTESFGIHAIFQRRLFISVSTQYANKIVFVVNIWRVHSGVPAGLRGRRVRRAWRWSFLRERKKRDGLDRAGRLRVLEIQQLLRIFSEGGVLL